MYVYVGKLNNAKYVLAFFFHSKRPKIYCSRIAMYPTGTPRFSGGLRGGSVYVLSHCNFMSSCNKRWWLVYNRLQSQKYYRRVTTTF